jgi:hypothetical protein
MARSRTLLLLVAASSLTVSGCSAVAGSNGVTGSPAPTPAVAETLPQSVTITPAPVSTVGRVPAEWFFSPGSTPSPGATSLTVVVRWRQCASGVAVQDPRPVVSYSQTHVLLSVWGIQPGNGGRCQSTMPTTIEVPLTEPLGNRTVTEGADLSSPWPYLSNSP